MNNYKSAVINIIVFCTTLLVMLIAAEFVFRKFIFSESNTFKGLRDPGYYSDYLNEDNYWKLYYIFKGEAKPPENPHQLLGWVGDFDRNSLIHHDTWLAVEKRPVLLYGDSYAQCMPGVECFQDILNSDSVFTTGHYLLNYGVGGYGVDQIYLLFKNSSFYYKDPFVVFSLMDYDIDRTPMTFRTGQKPYFEIEQDSLVLKGVPINPDPADFISINPPNITSYLYRRFLFSDANVFSDSVNKKLKRWDEYTNYKIQLNEKILLETVKLLREKNQDFVFLIFHYLKPGEEEFEIEYEYNWRSRFLKEFLSKNKIPYIWSKDIIKNDPGYTGSNYDKYMILENGHPTSYFNSLISDEIKKVIVKNEAIRNGDLNFIASMIKSDTSWFANVREKALKLDIPINEAIRRDAEYLTTDMVSSHKISPGPGYYVMRMKGDSVWQKDVSNKAIRNKVSIAEQQNADAVYLYNLEINNRRDLNSVEYVFDEKVKIIQDNLTGDYDLINSLKSISDSTGYSIKQLITKKALESYSNQLSNRTWP